MALKIKENKGVIYLQGNINSSTSIYFKKHILYVMNVYRDIELDIKEIESVDQDGLLCLKSIQKYANDHHRGLSIVNGKKFFNLNEFQIGA